MPSSVLEALELQNNPRTCRQDKRKRISKMKEDKKRMNRVRVRCTQRRVERIVNGTMVIAQIKI